MCVCLYRVTWGCCLHFWSHFLVPHQNSYFHNYSADEAAAAIESIVAWSAVRRFPSDFSNEIAPSPMVQWPISIFFVFLLTFFFTIQILAFEALHNSELQNRACRYHSVYKASNNSFPLYPSFSFTSVSTKLEGKVSDITVHLWCLFALFDIFLFFSL